MLPRSPLLLASSILALSVLRLQAPSPSAADRAQGQVRFVFLGSASEDAALGVRLGMEEAARSAALLGVAAPTLTVDSSGASAAHASPSLAGDSPNGSRVTAFIGGKDEASCATALAASAAHDALFLALRCNPGTVDVVSTRDGSMRGAYAGDTTNFALTFHMRAAGPGELWQASLESFGAAQLNQRFRARFNAPMSSMAWAGWMAVKIVTESALRTRSNEPRVLAKYMLDSTTRFDGHKGRPLSFSLLDHHLWQPVYRGNP
jgi:hypothetical protein